MAHKLPTLGKRSVVGACELAWITRLAAAKVTDDRQRGSVKLSDACRCAAIGLSRRWTGHRGAGREVLCELTE